MRTRLVFPKNHRSTKQSRLPRAVAALFFLLIVRPTLAQSAGDSGEPAKTFDASVRPLLSKYCFDCHSGNVTEGDLDLGAFKSVADVRKAPEAWAKVREMLDSGQMPPKDAEQLPDVERKLLRKWVRDYLTALAEADAGDPGPVLLRRLNNAEYTYTIQDLTGVDTLDPTQEFPVDGAAGEGFTNAGGGQGMSPALFQKYLDAGKKIAEHMVLLPEGIRFSPSTTRRDQTDELLAQIQAFYRQFTADGGGTDVNLQGIKFSTNQGGLLPVEDYLVATLAEREALQAGQQSISAVASKRGLNAKYLQALWQTLTSGDTTNPFLVALRQSWTAAKPQDAPALATKISDAQKALWQFNSIGHIGREGGPTAWMVPVNTVISSQEFRVPLPEASAGNDIILFLTASQLLGGDPSSLAVWKGPRIEFNGQSGPTRPPIFLRDIRSLTGKIDQVFLSELDRTAQYLSAVAELKTDTSLEQVAEKEQLHPGLLRSWANFVGLGHRAKLEVTGHFQKKLVRVQGYEAINGWGGSTPSLLTNRSDEPINILTLTLPPRGVTVHPAPDQESVVAWRSPIDGRVRIEVLVADADDKCGNGAAWRVERLSHSGAAVLAQGIYDNGQKHSYTLPDAVSVRTGEIVSLIVNARDNNHVCDTTHIELKLTEEDGPKRVWDLAADIVDTVLQSNPHPDSHGNADVWHFCATTPTQPRDHALPPNSSLARWRTAVLEETDPKQLSELAVAVQNVAITTDARSLMEPDQTLRQSLRSWSGPLDWIGAAKDREAKGTSEYGLEESRFGKHPSGASLEETDLCVAAPHVLAVKLPARLVAGGEFVATGLLDASSDANAAIQLQVLTEKPEEPPAVSAASPVLVQTGSPAQRAVEAALDEFRNLFPPALCYARIVPVDEVVTLTLFYREDHHLRRLMLDEQQAAELDRLWDELLYVSQEPLKMVVAFEQILEFASQDRPDLVEAFQKLREPINERAERFRERLAATEPAQLQGLLQLANRAWRRPLTESEQENLRELYRQLRGSDLPHEEALRLLLARILTSPAFLYKLEQPAPGSEAAPVSDLELASRLSYFLWSSLPDDELRALAHEGRLTEDQTLVAQARRMLQDERTRRLAVQFACQWLHLRDFDKNDDKNENLYPEFAELRDDMYEETVRFFEDMFRNNGSILDLLLADHTFLNQELATHYGVDGVTDAGWQRVEGVRSQGRGGVLGMATFLASQSGASRTSPILRGNWVYETLLGERLPRPPAGVPQLPDAVPTGLTARQLIEQHSSVESCAKCHKHIDPFGFALEQYDAIGRLRPEKANVKTTLETGKTIEGIDGLREYLATDRRDQVVRQFCRKLLGFALGREIQFSDELFLNELQAKLKQNDYRFAVAVEAIVTCPQFRMIRGQGREESAKALENSKSDARNPKQVQNSKLE